jgi:CP family cyanate transporter-like MFS transporter
VLQGLGQGGLFSVVMTVIILRSPDARTAAGLSGMAQGIGYVFAASGPLLVGLIRSSAGSFAPVGLLFAGLGLASAAFAWGAGRNRLVLTRGS